MPNWCNNTLLITAENKKEILLSLKTEFSDFDYNTVVPMPPHQPDVDKPNAFWAEGNQGKEQEDLYGKENCWYDWSIKHWGVKWNCKEAWVDEEAGRIDFSTPWSPPLAVIQALSAKFPNATFTLGFDEPGMQFAGTYTYVNGILEHKEDLEYEEVNEDEEELC
jgi:hypothetical protein